MKAIEQYFPVLLFTMRTLVLLSVKAFAYGNPDCRSSETVIHGYFYLAKHPVTEDDFLLLQQTYSYIFMNNVAEKPYTLTCSLLLRRTSTQFSASTK